MEPSINLVVFSSASAEEFRYLVGVLEILRGDDPIVAVGIKHAVDARQDYREFRLAGSKPGEVA